MWKVEIEQAENGYITRITNEYGTGDPLVFTSFPELVAYLYETINTFRHEYIIKIEETHIMG